MDRFTIETTPAADRQINEIVDWLREHASVSRLVMELATAVRILAVTPRAGVSVDQRRGLRRLLLRRSQLHLYYAIDDARRRVTIRAFWHTARGGPPPL